MSKLDDVILDKDLVLEIFYSELADSKGYGNLINNIKDLFRQLVLDSSDEMLKEDTVSASELMKIMRRRIEEL